MRILLVEDEPLILMGIEASLEEAGHSVMAASNADDAIKQLTSSSVDLILTDIDMPGSMDGLRLAAAVRDRWPPVKIVVMSGKRKPGSDQLPKHARFISKPFPEKELMKVIGGW